MSNIQLIMNLINQSHYQTYHTQIARYLGSIEAAILFSELVQRHQYHETREELIHLPNSDKKWFYHTKEKIEERTAMNRYNQDRAITILKKFNLMDTLQYGMPCKRYFSLNFEGFEELSKNLSRKSTVDRQGSPPSTNTEVDGKPTGPLYIKEPKEEPKKKYDSKSEASPSHEFGALALSFFSKLKEMNSKTRNPDLHRWAIELEKLSQDGDGSTIEEIEKVIIYALEHCPSRSEKSFSWSNVILSPTSLRKHFSRLWKEMNSSPQENLKRDVGLVKIIRKNNPSQENKEFMIGTDYIEFIYSGSAPSKCFKSGSRGFYENVIHQCHLKKLKLG